MDVVDVADVAGAVVVVVVVKTRNNTSSPPAKLLVTNKLVRRGNARLNPMAVHTPE